MDDKTLTKEEVLQAILNYVAAGVNRPEGSVTIKELHQAAKERGEPIGRETIRTRLESLCEAGKAEKIKVAGRAYYRMKSE